MKESGFRILLLLVAIALLACQAARAQPSYSKGQSVNAAFEGWEQNADGSYKFLFGYMNSNWEEEFDVPIGPDNNIEPGGPDRGQPTHFFPRRNRFVFWVNVPKDFGDKELVWTLTTHGKTSKAYATLRQDYFLDNMVLTSETGAIRGRSSGSGKVHFSPDQPKTWEDTRAGANSQWSPLWQAPPQPADGKWAVQVTFDEPGTYVLRWHASDGALWADEDIAVTVTP